MMPSREVLLAAQLFGLPDALAGPDPFLPLAMGLPTDLGRRQAFEETVQLLVWGVLEHCPEERIVALVPGRMPEDSVNGIGYGLLGLAVGEQPKTAVGVHEPP